MHNREIHVAINFDEWSTLQMHDAHPLGRHISYQLQMVLGSNCECTAQKKLEPASKPT
jgi:hypothetical protein